MRNFKGWWPCDTSLYIPLNPSIFAYNVVTRNGLFVNGIDKYSKSFANVNLSPKPANSRQTLVIEPAKAGHLSIELFDLQGHFLKTIYNSKSTGEKLVLQNDVENLAQSMYIYLCY